LSTIPAKLGGSDPTAWPIIKGWGTPNNEAGSAAESGPHAMAKLFNNAGDKPIPPSFTKPPIAMAE
jgi:hypothetical protein